MAHKKKKPKVTSLAALSLREAFSGLSPQEKRRKQVLLDNRAGVITNTPRKRKKSGHKRSQ